MGLQDKTGTENLMSLFQGFFACKLGVVLSRGLNTCLCLEYIRSSTSIFNGFILKESSFSLGYILMVTKESTVSKGEEKVCFKSVLNLV